MVKSILDEAKEIILDRADTHGEVEHNTTLISIFWSAYIAAGPPELQPHDVHNMRILEKISRSRCGQPKRDHYADIAGYAELANRLTEKGEDDGN